MASNSQVSTDWPGAMSYSKALLEHSELRGFSIQRSRRYIIIACEGVATGTKASGVADLVVETMASLVVAGVEIEWYSVRVFSKEVFEAETTEVEVAVR